MTDSASGSRPTPPPPPSAGSQRVSSGRTPRPSWGPLDTWPAFLLVGLTLLAMFAPAVEDSTGDVDTTVSVVGAATFITALIQQGFQGGWPWIVSKWKGLGLASDWKFSFEWFGDIKRGAVVAIACILFSGAMSALMTVVVGLSEDEDPSNTNIIGDNLDSPWIIGVLLLVLFGAPLTEELLYRGLLLRAFEKYLGIYVAVAVSTVIFTIPHYQIDATWGETAVLFAGIGTVGLVLAIATVRFNRLGPAIIGHFFFNAFGTTVTLIGELNS